MLLFSLLVEDEEFMAVRSLVGYEPLMLECEPSMEGCEILILECERAMEGYETLMLECEPSMVWSEPHMLECERSMVWSEPLILESSIVAHWPVSLEWSLDGNEEFMVVWWASNCGSKQIVEVDDCQSWI